MAIENMIREKGKAVNVVGCRYANSCDYKKAQRLLGSLQAVCMNSEGCSQQIYGYYGQLQESKKTSA